MSDVRFHPEATRAYAGVVLFRVLTSVPSILLFFLAGVAVANVSLQHAAWILPCVTAAIAVFSWYVLWKFTYGVLWDDAAPAPDSDNIAGKLSADMIRALARERERNAPCLLRAAVATGRGAAMLRLIGVDRATFLRSFEFDVHDAINVTAFLQKADAFRLELQEERIDGNVIVYLFLVEGGPEATAFLNEQDLSMDDLRNIVQWERFHWLWDKAVHAWNPSVLVRMFGSIGRGWVQGYTDELDAYSTELTDGILHRPARAVTVHRDALQNILRILSRPERQNVLILGRSGVGKQAIVENIAYALRKQETENSLPLTRVLLLHSELLVSGSDAPDAVLMRALSKASHAGRFVLVVDNLAVLTKTQKGDLLAVLGKFLRSPLLSLVAIADPEEYQVLLKREPGIGDMMEIVQLDDTHEQESLAVLMEHAFMLEDAKRVRIPYSALRSVLQMARRYVSARGMPGAAVDLLDDAVALASERRDVVVLEEHVRAAVSAQSRIDVQHISMAKRDQLLNLKEAMQERIVGQDAALQAIADALKRSGAELGDRNRPIGTFLFLGPTGVGKTQTAKVLAQQYYGGEEHLIRLDMNEYSSEDAVKLLIGAPDVSDELAEGYLARRVQEHPSSLILLDEIEKAHPKVINVFLQVLDEGMLIDSVGNKTDFRHTIIIATSNAGALFLRSATVGDSLKKELIDALIAEKVFSPEFLNRFDEIVLYKSLSLEDATRVSRNMIESIVAELRTKRGVTVTLEEGVVEAVVRRGYSREFGAREMRRAIVEFIENVLAEYMLKHDVKRGDTIHIRVQDLPGA